MKLKLYFTDGTALILENVKKGKELTGINGFGFKVVVGTYKYYEVLE